MMTAPAPSLFRVFFRVASGTTGGRIVFAVCALMTAQGTGLRAAPGDIDTGFNPPFYINSPTSAPIIYGGVPLPDGSAVFCGSFIGLITGPAIATRLKTDGAVQTDFAAAAGNATLHVVAVQTDGKCLFSGLAPTAYFKRHLVDGSVDASFTAAPSADVRAITQQADGKLIIAGTFATVSGVARRGIARLNVADGSVDTSFDANVNGDVYSVALLPDGKMVIGGDFTQVGSVNRNQMARLNADGTLDSTFDAHLATSLSVQFVVVQADSKVIAGGPFTTTSALGRAGIARFNTDGSLDSLSITGPLVVSTVAVQADGKLILAGPFSTVNGTSNQGIVRLLADGTLDNSFKVTSFYGSSYVTLLANGKVMSTGGVVGQSVRGAARLLNDPASATFSIVSSSKVRWLRGGSAAEAQQVTFETSTDGGSTWNMLGTASRITGGWELSGPSLPAAGKLRARGRVAGGFDCGSSGIIEQVQSFSGTTLQGGDASLSGLSVSVGTLSGPFKPDVLNYSESVGTSSTSLTVTPTATDSRATVRVNGNNVASGSPSSPINLTPGNNTITIDVTAEDGTALAYSIKVYRSPTTLNAAFNSAIDVPATANGYIATGSAVNLSLNFAPPVGTELMVVKNTSLNWIQGTFSNLSQGQRVPLSFGGTTYYFVADYFGGSGNDLVLHWATVKPFAWGQYISNQPGKATGYEQLPVAVNQTGVLAGKTVAAISCGENHTLVLTSDGKVVAWGSNTSGQLGDGTTKNRTLPVLANTTGALSGKAVTAIAAGNEFSVAACSDGTVVAWGLNHHGQLGNGTTTKSALPVAVTSAGTPLAGRTVTSLAAGDDHCLALCADGTLLAWGGNFGALGNNTNTDKSTVPVQVTTISTPLEGKAVTSISAGQSYSLALCSDGTLAGWGHNLFGALGSGMGTDSQVPIPVTRTGTALEGKVVVSIAAGYDHSLAACADGSVVSWGSNALGIAGLNYSNVPVAVTTTGTALQGKQVTSVAAGVFDSLAICSDGTAVAWGMTGTLGNNSVWWQSETALAVDRTGVLAGKSVTLAGMGFFHAVVLCTDG